MNEWIDEPASRSIFTSTVTGLVGGVSPQRGSHRALLDGHLVVATFAGLHGSHRMECGALRPAKQVYYFSKLGKHANLVPQQGLFLPSFPALLELRFKLQVPVLSLLVCSTAAVIRWSITMSATLNCLQWMASQEGQNPCSTAQEVGQLCNHTCEQDSAWT